MKGKPGAMGPGVLGGLLKGTSDDAKEWNWLNQLLAHAFWRLLEQVPQSACCG